MNKYMSKLLFLAGVVAVAYALFLWYPIYKAVKKSVSLIDRALPYQQTPTEATMHILVAGDSTGVGVGVEDIQDSIAGRIGKDFPQATIENISKSSSTLRDLLLSLGRAGDGEYNLVVLQIGANDITRFNSYTDIRNTLVEVLERASTLGQRVLVLTAGNVGSSPVFRWPLSSIISHRTRVVRSIFLEEVAKRPNVTYVDLFQERKDDVFLTDAARYFANDYFHPSGDGYGVWYMKIKPLLVP